MHDPSGVLSRLHRVVKPDGVALIRIPVVSSQAWRTYGVDWVQLDAPRHLFLHSEKSMRILAERTGFSISDVIHDSSAFQFWGSEQYRRDIPLMSESSYDRDPKRSIFSKEEIARFDAQAAELNAQGDGDSACFYLRKGARPTAVEPGTTVSTERTP